MARVLCDPTFPLEQAREVLAESGVAVELSAPPWAGDDVVGLLAFVPVTAADVDRLGDLRVISTPSVGYEHLDVDAATRRGVWVCNVPDYCIDEMADHTIALLLALVRGVVELDRSVRSGVWSHTAAGPLQRISDVRLGLVGLGRIGRAVAARARALGMEVSAYDPFLSEAEITAESVRPAPLDDLLRWSTAVSIHVPLSDETYGLVGPRELELLRDGTFVLNVSRAGLVDTEALLVALRAGRLGGVALDVLEVEPPVPAAPAPQAERLIVNPHAGWYSERAEEAVFRRAAESVLEALEGRRPRNAVNDPVVASRGR